MRLFALRDDNDPDRETLAVLTYYERAREFYFDLPEGADPWTVPLILSSFAERGAWEVGHDWAFSWVRSRVVPESRQNLGEVLRVNGLDEYDEFALLEMTGGRCAQDDCYLDPLDFSRAPAWYVERQGWRVADAVPLTGARLFAAFRDGATGVLDAHALALTNEAFARVACDERVFAAAEVGPGGREVRWGARCRLTWGELRQAMEFSPIRTDDLGAIVSAMTVDASQAAETLGCTRQNVAALAQRGRLTAVKSGQKCTLFMRSEVRGRAE